MADHTIIARYIGGGIGIFCKEDVERLDNGARDSWRLDELAEIAHEHITRAEQDDRDRRVRAIYG